MNLDKLVATILLTALALALTVLVGIAVCADATAIPVQPCRTDVGPHWEVRRFCEYGFTTGERGFDTGEWEPFAVLRNPADCVLAKKFCP